MKQELKFKLKGGSCFFMRENNDVLGGKRNAKV